VAVRYRARQLVYRQNLDVWRAGALSVPGP
jgi:hypothetical protein